MFNIFTNRNQVSGVSNEFANAACQCVQQELDLSELNWMDTSAYTRSKEMLRHSSAIAIRTRLAFNKQRDLFEGV
ncbi:MAG: hypothetical protein HN338_03020 [Candidatus Ruthia sp.]|nr:hypothetical protein [Candidatus Ruthturnera sp.]